MNKIPKVLIAIPTMGQINALTVVSLINFFAQSVNQKDKNIMFYPTMGIKPVEKARNEIVDQFLKTDATHLFWIDADTIPPLDALDKMLKHDKDIVSGLTPIIEHDPMRANDSAGFYKKWNCVGEDDQLLKPNMGLVPIKGAGGSCLLVKRKVYEKAQKPVYRFLDKDDNGKPAVISEDIYFTIMAISNGFKPYCDTSIIAGHCKEIIWR